MTNNFLRRNSWFLAGFILFLALALLFLAQIEKGEAIMYFNSRRSWFGDLFFRFSTHLGEAGVYLLALVGLLFVRYRHALTIPLLGIVVTLISYFSKLYFAHDRPYLYFKKLNQLDQLNTIEGVTLFGGQTSFPSGHSMSAFAIYAFLSFCLPWKKGLALAFLTAAILTAVSRIYLVQHFLQDVTLGAVMGVAIAIGMYYLHLLPKAAWLDKRLYWPKNRA